MNENKTQPDGKQTSFQGRDANSFSQYLSFHYYKENLDHLSGITKDSINNFLKTISEIEDEFMILLKGQQAETTELYSLEFENSEQYMEENY